MVRRNVEQLKIASLGFHVARAINLEAHLRPDGADLAQRLRGNVQAAARCGAAGQRHIQGAGLQAGSQAAFAQRCAVRSVRLLQLHPQRIGALPGQRALGGR